MIVELFNIHDAERMRRALAIRLSVFVEEQGVPLDEEVDAHDRTDADAVHALGLDGSGRDVAAGRYYVTGESTAQVGRMAVAADARGRGAGAAVLAALVAEARRRGLRRVHLHAQVTAVDFYRKFGFGDDGEPLWDAGILHQPMSLRIDR